MRYTVSIVFLIFERGKLAVTRSKYLFFIASVILIVLVLSSCFLLPKPTLTPPQLVSPANGATNVGTSVNLVWKSSVSNATYKVFFGTSQSPTYLTTVSTTSYTVNNLEYSTTYYWNVVTTANGQSATSTTWSFTTMKVPAPSAPVLKITGVSTTSIALGWTQSKLASMITVYGATSTVFSQYAILSGSSTSYTVSGLIPSTAYKFFLVATNSSGRATSNTVSATTQSYTPPVVPVLPVINTFGVTSVSTNTITLGFTTSHASIIYIYNPPSTKVLATALGTSTAYTVQGLTPSTAYKYFIVAINPFGRATSTTITATTAAYISPTTEFSVYITDKPVSPSQIQHLYVKISGISVHITNSSTEMWYTSSASGTYDLTTLVGTSIKLATFSLPSTWTITQIRFNISSATIVINGTSYPLNIPSSTLYINTQAISAFESNSTYLDFDLANSVEQTGQGYIFKPVIHVVNENVKASLMGYVMYNSEPVAMAVVSLSNPSTTVAQTYTKPNGSFMIVAVQSGSYTLTVSASGLSSYSTSVTLAKGMNNIGTINLSQMIPSTPTLSLATPNPYLAVLTWTQSISNANGFHVWESNSPMQAMTEIQTLPGTVTNYDVAIKPYTSYYFKVSAYNSVGQTWSNTVSTKTTVTLYIPSVNLNLITSVATIGGTFPLIATAVIYHNVPTLKSATAKIGTISVSAQSLTASPLTFDFPSLTGLTSGSYTATVTVVDAQNNSASNTSRKIYVDNQAPTIALKLNGTYFSPKGTPLSWTDTVSSTYATNLKLYCGSTLPTLYATVTDNSLYHVTVESTYNKSTISITGNNSDKATFNKQLISGTATLTVKATDDYGNVDTLIVTFTATQNTTLPIVKITMPATIGIPTTSSSTSATITVYATAGNLNGGNRITSLTINKTSATKESANTWAAKITLNAGANTLDATAVDLYENTKGTSTSIYVDNATPTISVTLTGGTGITSSPYTLTKGSSVTLYTNSTAGLSGSINITDNSKMPVTAMATEITTKSTVLNFTTTSGASVATFKSTGTLNGSLKYTIEASATDAFGHKSTYIATYTLVVDNTPPTLKISAPATVGSGKTFTATVTVTDTQSGVNASTFTATYDGETVSSGDISKTPTTNGYKFTLTLNAPTESNTGAETTLTTSAEDNAGNLGSTSTSVYVDGQAPTITLNFATSPKDVYFVNGSTGSVNLTQTSTHATVYLYYGTSPSTLISGVATDNSNYEVSIESTYNGKLIGATYTAHVPVTLSFKLVGGETTFTASAADMFGNSVKNYKVSFVATQDTTAPTVSFNASPTNYHNANWAASPTIVASYSANDNAGGSGLLNGEVKFYITSKSGTVSFLTNGGTDKTTTNLIPYLKSNTLGIVNNGSTDVNLTIAATDNVGNYITPVSTTWTVNLTFSISSISTATVSSTTALILRFNTLYSTTTSFTASDVHLTYTASNITYYASQLTTPSGTTDILITQFASGSTSGPLVSAKDLKSGSYTVDVTNVVSKNNDIPLSNNGASESL